MTFKLKRGLWLWAGALVLILLSVIPASTWVRLMVILAVACSLAFIWRSYGQKSALNHPSLVLADHGVLPPSAYRQPVVLVCGDALTGLFGDIASDELALRVTEQGCYVRVCGATQLPIVADSLLAMRPQWGGQLSVMYVVNPGEHTDGGALAGQIQAFCHQLLLLRKRGIVLSLFVVSYLQAAQGEGPWFSWQAGQDSPSVHEANAIAGMAEWQREADDHATVVARLNTSVQLKSAAHWLTETVLAHFTSGDARYPLIMVQTIAVTCVPVLVQKVEHCLWQKWLQGKTTLVDSQQPKEVAGIRLPFPDPLLHLIPTRIQYSAVQQAGVIAAWLLAAAMLVALANSAWQNTLLARQVTDDLRRYTSIIAPERREQPEFVLREDAVSVLRQDALRLDNYYRHGEPVSLGLGLYRGERLRAPLLAVIANHRQPAMAAVPVNAPRAVRLDSLSLFSTGSAQLKPDSTKVLINALTDIKAQPGWLIVIAGHTDDTGNVEHNLQLSRARAAAVRDWMQRMGDIPDACFAVQGFGASQPIASNDNESGRAMNRRVDIRLVPEVGACELSTAKPGRQNLSRHAAIND